MFFAVPPIRKRRYRNTEQPMTYNELLHYVFQAECKLFMKMDSWRVIKQKCSIKCFNPIEREQLEEDIHHVFELLIKMMKQSCANLTKEDIVFCCLVKLGLDNAVISRCLGSPDKRAANQRKYRIKIKMQEAQCQQLFEIIFDNK